MKLASLMVIAALLALTGVHGSVPAGIPHKSRAENALDPAGVAPEDEQAAWDLANKAGTPAAFKDFYRNYPHSARFKVTNGTLRGRYWFRVGDIKHTDGVLVTVEGMKILTSISLRDALAQHILSSKPYPLGATYDAVGRTFNYVYMEVVEGWFPPVSVGRGGVQTQVVSPKDSPNATIVVSADGKRLLTWDLTKAHAAESPALDPTFIPGVATLAPFADSSNGGAWDFDKSVTPPSQAVDLQGKRIK